MKIEVSEKTYKLIEKGAEEFCNGNIAKYLEEILMEYNEIVPTRDEKIEWKKNLYNTLLLLATERPEFYPKKRDSLETLKESFFCWAETYNDGYFSEMDEADSDKYCAWLVQEYDKY